MFGCLLGLGLKSAGLERRPPFDAEPRRRVANPLHAKPPSHLPHIVVTGLAFVLAFALTVVRLSRTSGQDNCWNKRQTDDNDVRQAAGSLHMLLICHSSSRSASEGGLRSNPDLFSQRRKCGIGAQATFRRRAPKKSCKPIAWAGSQPPAAHHCHRLGVCFNGCPDSCPAQPDKWSREQPLEQKPNR